ncbi:glutathione S-transferase [Pleomassaria siparia CBS 279.74]|uniref:glutathione transferase n=1 Tax=Pleomassaria siparia CBS 279.74 TaxID=1314801 RepID=A0A6G1JU19_9PLEO|nr:glutathione S-transferase [Pleomassaria siparia CBS 279.74]
MSVSILQWQYKLRYVALVYTPFQKQGSQKHRSQFLDSKRKMVQPIIVWSAPGGPNPFKVVIVLEELGIPYDLKIIGYSKLKQKPYTDLNPNGRCPTIEDPNTGLILWESGAILQYLIDQYDTEEKLHYKSFPEKYHQSQWIAYQISGQGPYFGQAAWFNMFHPEKIPSVQERYMNEINRVVSVLDGVLADRASGWLVGDKVTYADLIFVMWNEQLPSIFSAFPEKFDIEKYPHYKKWAEGMKERESVKNALGKQQELIAETYAGKHV